MPPPGPGSAGSELAAGAEAAVRALLPVLDELDEAVAVLDDAGAILATNEAFTLRYGYAERLPGSTSPDYPVWPAERRSDYQRLLGRALGQVGADGRAGPFDVVLRDEGGNRHRCLVTLVRWEAEGRPLVVAVTRPHDSPEARNRKLERALHGIAAELRALDGGVAHVGPEAIAARLADRAGLSPQQRAVLELFAEGLTVRCIAERLHLSAHTVRGHLKAIFRRLGVHSQDELRSLLAEPAPSGPDDTPV